MVIRRVAIADLHHDPANVRLHDERNLLAVTASLKEFGQVEPLVIQKGTNKVIGGNARLTALIEMGEAECDVVEYDGTATQATALGIALNRTSEFGKWDVPALADMFESLKAEDFDLGAIGFSDLEMGELLAGFEAPTNGEINESPPDDPGVADWKTRFELVVECASEADQETLYNRLTAEGRKCRILSL